MLKYVHDFVCTYPGESLTTKNTPLPPPKKKEKSYEILKFILPPKRYP